MVPDPAEILGNGTALVDGSVAPTWDWAAIPDLFSGKAGYPGMNIQVAATLDGQLGAVGPVPVHGARHDAHAFAASGLKDLLARHEVAADLGYTGVDGITIVPFRTPPGRTLHDSQAAFNKDLSALRAAIERAVAHLKSWRMLPKKAAASGPRSANTPRCSTPSPACSSSAITLKPYE